MRLLQWTILIVLSTTPANAKSDVVLDMNSTAINPGLMMPEGKSEGITSIHLGGTLTQDGQGKGTLHFNPNSYEYDEFGYGRLTSTLPLIKAECVLRFVKKGKLRIPESGRIAAPEIEVEWSFYEITGPKLVSKLFLAIESREINQPRPSARLLVHNKQGKVKHVFYLQSPGLPEPCHPGCFPAGTQIAVMHDTVTVESIKVGDRITTVSLAGKEGVGTVSDVFITRNRILEVRTDAGVLLTTVTQPLALMNGTLRSAGGLKQGDSIYRWISGKRVAVRVESVEITGRYESVYNVVLGEPTLFIANGYLARSKPPAE